MANSTGKNSHDNDHKACPICREICCICDEFIIIDPEQLQPGQRIDVDNFSEDLPATGAQLIKDMEEMTRRAPKIDGIDPAAPGSEFGIRQLRCGLCGHIYYPGEEHVCPVEKDVTITGHPERSDHVSRDSMLKEQRKPYPAPDHPTREVALNTASEVHPSKWCGRCKMYPCSCTKLTYDSPQPQPGNIHPVFTDKPIRKEIIKTDPLGEHKQLIVMVGLPYSGKSTLAKELSRIHHAPIVNPDSIRVALHGHKFIPEAEPHVWAIAKTMVRSLFLAGHDNVILDSTCVTEKRRKEWISYAAEWTVRYKYVQATLQECVDRAVDNDDLVMIPIIKSMHEEMTIPHTWQADMVPEE